MSSNKHRQNVYEKSPRTSPRSQPSPKKSRLYPDLSDELDDESDESWVMSSPGERTLSTTMTSSDHGNSSFMESSPTGRPPIHTLESSFDSPRLRSGRRYGAKSFSDHSDDSLSRSPKQHKSQKTSSEEKQNMAICPLVIGVLCSVVLICFVYKYSQPSNANAYPEQPKLYEQFKLQMTELKTKFPSQSSKAWKSLHIAAKHVLQDSQSVYPGVILMVGPSDSLQTMSCIGTQMVTMLNQLYNVSQARNDETQILVSELKHRSTDIEKENLDKKLQKIFNGGSKGAMLVNIEILSPQAALMLHSYCDNDNAPFPDVLLILQLVTDQLSLNDFKKQDVVEKFMLNLWEEELGIDRVMALFSRIANNVVPIETENSAILNEICG